MLNNRNICFLSFIFHKTAFLILALACLTLGACVTNRLLYHEPGGRAVYQVDCSGTAFTFGDCMAEAHKQCPGGIEVVMSSEREIGSVTNGSSDAQVISNSRNNMWGNSMWGGAVAVGQSSMSSYTTPVISRYMIYRCKTGYKPAYLPN